jgi:hypothetical protein
MVFVWLVQIYKRIHHFLSLVPEMCQVIHLMIKGLFLGWEKGGNSEVDIQEKVPLFKKKKKGGLLVLAKP